ncbi:hypothetical protein CsSME_00041130 [Camellia sinensis var. sinensis]
MASPKKPSSILWTKMTSLLGFITKTSLQHCSSRA